MEDLGDGLEAALAGEADMAGCHAQAAQVEDGAGGVLEGAGDAAGPKGAAALLGGGVEGEHQVADADALDRCWISLPLLYWGQATAISASYEQLFRRTAYRAMNAIAKAKG
ncbi:MAG: hypothetical protein K2X74_06425 [Acetobacteraceae bacterium]|nr:hypothetical protein [Acetobacteraceae bacterium]